MRGVLLLMACAAPFLAEGLPAAAQSGAALHDFLAEVERASRRFESVDSAIAAGYRKLGPDFPGMGEHWIHPGLVIAGALDPARPPVVAYTSFGTERRLVGVAYTRVLGPDEDPPAGPFPPAAWHDHTGGVDEESLLLAGPASMHPPESGFRLAMVHVWTTVANPEGVLAQNNWGLPFHRAGLDVPGDVSSEAARALSLAGVGSAFYEQLLREGIGLRGEELQVAIAAFESGASAVRAWLDGEDLARAENPAGEDGARSATAELEEVWAGVWRALDEGLGPEARQRLAVLRH